MADEIAIKINMADDIICHLVQLEVMYLLCQHILVIVLVVLMMINFANRVTTTYFKRI